MKKKHKQNCGCIVCRENVSLQLILLQVCWGEWRMSKTERYMEWEKHNNEYYGLGKIDSC